VSEPTHDSLKRAIERLHGGVPAWEGTVRVRVPRKDGSTWEGDVHAFVLNGHVVASRCYAWTFEGSDGSHRHRIALHMRESDTPEDVVRAMFEDDGEAR